MVKTGSWILFTALAILMGLYPAIYFLMDRTFGLLSSRPGDLLQNFYWNIGFYTHIILGGVALLIGWTQFSIRLRTTHLGLHRQTGKVYVAAALLSSLSGIGIGIFATGGPVAASGFILLGITWFVSTLLAYVYIREMEVEKHQKMMIYSYAACFAAVT